jgi:hypothetical protein
MYQIKTIKQTCFGCPSQWEGKTVDDHDIYIRYRGGYLRLDIDGKTECGMEVGDDFDGCIGLEEALTHMANYITMCKEATAEYYGY